LEVPDNVELGDMVIRGYPHPHFVTGIVLEVVKIDNNYELKQYRIAWGDSTESVEWGLDLDRVDDAIQAILGGKAFGRYVIE